MAKGNYIVSANEDKTDIIFQLSPTADQEIPVDQQDLLFDVQATVDVVKVLYQDANSLYATYFDQLLKLAQVGLVGENAQPLLAKKALEQLKNEIVNRESGKVKNKYLKKLGVKALWFGMPALLLGVAFNGVFCKLPLFCETSCIDYKCLANFLILWAGTMSGVWLSFAITRTYIGFGDLVIIEKDRLEPSLRLVFTGLLAIIFGLLFVKKVIEIKLGDLSSFALVDDSVTAFLLGVILGLNEKMIGNALTKKTASLLEK